MTVYSAVRENFPQIMEGLSDDSLFPWSPDIQEACAESAQKTFSTWAPPQPLFAAAGSASGKEATVNWWTRRNALAYVTGICPIFMLMAPEINEESLIEALRYGTDLDLSVEDLDNACKSIVG